MVIRKITGGTMKIPVHIFFFSIPPMPPRWNSEFGLRISEFHSAFRIQQSAIWSFFPTVQLFAGQAKPSLPRLIVGDRFGEFSPIKIWP